MNSKIIEYLQKKGYTPYQGFYPTIDLWISLWKGKTEFHEYEVVYGNRRYKEKMYSLGMPQRIANDWANIGWSEKDTIVTSTKNQKYLDDTLEEVDFQRLLHKAIEKSAYSGTCGAIWRVKNAKLINEIGIKYSEKYKVKWLYSDFKKDNGYKHSIELSKIYNLYRQDYCGCIYSKKEREEKNQD